MPDPAATVATLIFGRPVCLTCVADRSRITDTQAAEILAVIGSTLALRIDGGRCAACGTAATVYQIRNAC